MKKTIFLTPILFFVMLQNSYSQTVQASIGLGSSPNSIRIYLLPTITDASAVFSTLQFNVSIPNTISPAPTLSLVSQPFSGVTWIIDPPYDEDGFWNYNIYNGAAGYTLGVTAAVEFVAMELAFNGGPPGNFANSAHLTNLGIGGNVSSLAYFFCSGELNSASGNLFYDRDGAGPDVVVQNNDSYNVAGLAGLSYARFSPPITLPVVFSGYDVKCNDKGALVSWSTSSELNSSKFEIQRSTNGTDWKTIGTVASAGNSNEQRSYQYLDISGGGSAQYRIRQVDLDGEYTYTSIRLTNCKNSVFDVILYPVPVNDLLHVVVKSEMNIQTELKIIDMTGRTVSIINAQLNKGSTNIQIPTLKLPAGQYLLASSDPAIKINSKFVVAH